MRTYLLLAIIGLLVTEALLLPRAIKDFRVLRRIRSENAPVQGVPATLRPFAGFDAAGRSVTLVTDETKWILPIVIRPAKAAFDIEYLNKLRKAVPNRELTILGVCDPSACTGGSPSKQAVPGVTVVAYGSYAPFLDIGRFDDRDQLLLLNQYWGVKQALPRPSSPEKLATEIQKAIAP